MELVLEGGLQVGKQALLLVSLLISKKRGKHVHMMSSYCYFLKLLRWSGREGVHDVALDLFSLEFGNQLTLFVDLYLLIFIDNPPCLLDCSYLQH